MRISSLHLFASVACVAALSLAGACGEHVPSEIVYVPTPDAGAATDAGDAPLESAAPALVSAAKRRDAVSSPVIFDRERGGVWTANGDVGTVSYVDVAAHKVAREVAVGKDVRSVALSPDARWIAAVDRVSGTVALIDAESFTVRRTLAVGTHPRAAVWDAWNPRWLYVTLEDAGAVALVDRTLGVVARTIPVGRLPSGLAVSRLRNELAVMHRIDAKITLVGLEGVYSPADLGASHADVALAPERPSADPTVPQGQPFAFEALAWAPDGTTAWVPHELLTARQPIQFQTTLFPAVSVVDLSDARAEIASDPGTAPFSFAGRKLLFGAINVPDATGATTIVSQPCAAAVHPGGLVAYAVACGSEDLITFDATTGKAIDLLRDLPGDHPVGAALDDTGARLFILSDQSQTLIAVDLAGGSPLRRPSLLGEPVRVVANDPVLPELREGLKLFFRANSAKGDVATTGNGWMSCGGCHLDGFVSTNQVFFDALHAKDPRVDAQIGHVGLKDLFSTAPTPEGAAFDPHDVLVAFADQGGLAPDRTGARRDGAIDPSLPSAAARTMASRVARVIARDLPMGPSWLLPGAPKPDAAKDGEWCGNCHKPEYDAWKKSAHAHAGEDPMVRYGLTVEQKARGPQYARLCAGCHAPVDARSGDVSLTSGRGISCLGCHDVTRLVRAGGNADLEAAPHDWTQDHKAWGLRSLETLRKPEFCGGCHQQFVPGSGIEAIGTLREWTEGTSSGHLGYEVALCVDCHQPASQIDTDGGSKTRVTDHAMVGGNVYLAGKFNDAAFVQRVATGARLAIKLTATRKAGDVEVHAFNNAGHSFPTGVTDIREPWIELQAVDAQKNVIARYGGPGKDGLLPPTAARLGMDIAKPDGTLLFQHELSESTRVPFDRRVRSGAALDFVVPAPAALPAGATELHAVLLYRNVKTAYLRAATGDPAATAPEVEAARTVVK